MGGGGGSPPTPPNPYQVSQQQTQSNVETGISNAVLGNTNQITPQGSLNYQETGGRQVGNNWVPSYTATQTLSPEQQAIYNATTGLQQKALGQIAPQLLNRVQGTVSTPLDYSSASALPTDQTQLRNDAYGALTARSNQDLDRQTQQQQTQLANQGIAAGTEAYDNAMRPIERARVDASNQATVNAGNVAGQNLGQAESLRGSQIADITNLRNSPLQDYSTLLGLGGGVSPATYAPPSGGQVAPTDVSGNVYSSYNGQVQAYQQQQQNQNAQMGGLFGLGGSLLGAGSRFFFPSDARLKENVRRIGTADNGIPLYAYNFRGDPRTQIGVIAQEIESIDPAAVMEIDGVKHVHYGRLFPHG